MRKIENECVDCGKPCMVYCPLRNVEHLYCDRCGADVEKLYVGDSSEELCLDCVLDDFKVIEL